uniref:Uncharacterized protein n=2 Tax=Corethron hystrix TaxID=216773 RepID=A0A7S1FYE1_9STRA|mmetsp:Transcript_37188/g.86712  ORF Transcript_37188/g.86712 Transcript_37188/m.86712 type:complete len:808 (+) Transcript_37188:164-2587(+)
MKKNMNGFTDKVVRSGSFDDAHNGAVTVERPKVKAIGISPIQNIKPVPLSMTAPTRSNNSILSSEVADDERQAKGIRDNLDSEKSNLALLHRLSLGVVLILHDGNSASGTPVRLSVQNDHNHILLTPIEPSNVENSLHNSQDVQVSTSLAPSWNTPLPSQHFLEHNEAKSHSSESSLLCCNNVQYIPTRLITSMDIGKTGENFQSTNLTSLHPMFCFSVVTERSTYCFQARSSLERETVVTALMVILNETYLDDVVSAERICREQQEVVGAEEEKSEPKSDATAPSTPTSSSKKPYFLSPSQRTYIHDNRTGNSSIHEDEGTEASLARLPEKDSVPVLAPFISDLPPRQTKKSTQSVDDGAHCTNTENSICVESEVKISHPESEKWCDQLCTMTLQDITDVMSDMLHDIDDVKICGETITNAICGPYGIIVPSCDSKNREVLEKNICTFLSSSTRSDSWFEGRVWSIFDVCVEKALTNEPVELRRVLRNRATVLNAQARRLKTLRDEMNFFYAVKSAGEKMSWIDITKSMDDADDDYLGILPTNHAVTSPASAKGSTTSCSFFSECSPPIITGSTKVDEGEDLFYDSDPGDIRVRHKASRKVMVDKKNVPTDSLRGETDKCGLHNVGIQNEKTVEENILQEMKNENFTLVWHPTQSKHGQNRSPVCVKSWIELGSRLRTRFVQPKFMWRAAFESKLDKKQLNVSSQIPNNIELLDICRIVPAVSIDRNLHPLAKLINSFSIETSDDIFMFEARSEEEKQRIIHGLKLVVARLASKLIVGDEDVYDEFFTPGGSEVAGEPPDWARSQH